MRILILCTGNSCRSQMAEGILRAFDNEIEVSSAGTKPEREVNKYAVAVMKEIDIDISRAKPKNVDLFVNGAFDFVITVCDNAREVCPVFAGSVKHRLHIGFEDPADAEGTDEEIMKVYRKTRDEIFASFRELYERELRAK